MRRNHQLFIGLVAIVGMFMAALSSCSFLETDESGTIGGFWHMERVDTLTTGKSGYGISAEMRYWSIQGRILETSIRNGYLQDPIIFRYEHKGDSLILTDPRVSDRTKEDPAITEVDPLRPYGINKLREGFYIVAVDKGKMMLRNDYLKLYFVKQ